MTTPASPRYARTVSEPAGEITRLLLAWRNGDRASRDKLAAAVYEPLRRLARGQLRHLRPGATLSSSDLVHEAYLKLADPKQLDFKDRGHFFAVVATAMRHILVDHARRRAARKRGSGQRAQPLEEAALSAPTRDERLVALDEALSDLERLDPRLGRVVELRVFGGLSVEETAEALELSPVTVKRDWRKARAFLHLELDRAGLS